MNAGYAMGGQMEQNVAMQHQLHHSNHAAATDSGDAVMARWLQSAGLQHLAAPLAAAALDHRLLPSLLMQDYARYGVSSLEDKQKLFRLIKTISSGAEPPPAEPTTPPACLHTASQSSMDDVFLSPEFTGDFGPEILDLHSIDDTEFFPETSIPEPFQSSPLFDAVTEKGFESEDEGPSMNMKQQNKSQGVSVSSPPRTAHNEKDRNGSSVARIKVVVRKRPINKKELARKEEDIITINAVEASLTVHEPKVKVDLTAYVEKHEFVFDAVLDQYVSNDEVYRTTVEPIVPTIFHRTKATCFAYGQTGSGKTYTMQPLPLRATQDIMNLMQQTKYRSQGLQLWLSFFEIYGGKLYDLLNERRKLCMREDGRQQVCIVGLQEYRVSHVELVKEYIDKGNSARSTGSTGANEESSRSHAILQLVIKKAQEVNDTKGNRVVGKISFIDLAGSERGADTTDNDRQTRMEGAEINKSLLALKECIRALDNDQGHIPFRGSKLTEVLRDSFMGDSRTVMISCVSPNAGSCEHTLNTLRYADRVKGLSKNNNSKKDLSCSAPIQREATTSPPPLPIPVQLTPQVPDYVLDNRAAENGRCPPFDSGYSQHGQHEGLNNQSNECTFSGRTDSRPLSGPGEKDTSSHVDMRDGRLYNLNEAGFHETERVQVVLPSRRKVGREEKVDRQVSRDDVAKPESVSSSHVDMRDGRLYDLNEAGSHETERVQVVLPSRRKVAREEKVDRQVSRDDVVKPESISSSHVDMRDGRLYDLNEAGSHETERVQVVLPSRRKVGREEKVDRQVSRDDVAKLESVSRRQNGEQLPSAIAHSWVDSEVDIMQFNHEGHINAILEEEEEVISAHRKEVEDTMEMVREEMKLLAEVDQPGSRIDHYVSELNYVLSQKAAGIINLQARLARFQRHLKEQEILSRTGGVQQM